MADHPVPTRDDETFMAEAIRISRAHLGRTGTNPSVGTVIVRDGQIIGRGVTALGGRPHAETIALAEAGEGARGATAYVTLEPCAHHGRTPPCAEALVGAGVTRVVCALTDPDDRVAGRGFAILRNAGIEVVPDCLPREARKVLGSYLNRSLTKRAQVTLKLAVSADGALGRKGEGQVPITGPAARDAVHRMRAEHEAIMVGSATVLADDPELTVRLDGAEDRSPMRVVVDTGAVTPLDSRLMKTLARAPVVIATCEPQGERAQALAAAGARILACEAHDGRVALPELMEDLAAIGVTRVFAEGGAALARALLAEGLVERVMLFSSPVVVGGAIVQSPLLPGEVPEGFAAAGSTRYGDDLCEEFERL